jgi:hypothetical protein
MEGLLLFVDKHGNLYEPIGRKSVGSHNGIEIIEYCLYGMVYFERLNEKTGIKIIGLPCIISFCLHEEVRFNYNSGKPTTFVVGHVIQKR